MSSSASSTSSGRMAKGAAFCSTSATNSSSLLQRMTGPRMTQPKSSSPYSRGAAQPTSPAWQVNRQASPSFWDFSAAERICCSQARRPASLAWIMAQKHMLPPSLRYSRVPSRSKQRTGSEVATAKWLMRFCRDSSPSRRASVDSFFFIHPPPGLRGPAPKAGRTPFLKQTFLIETNFSHGPADRTIRPKSRSALPATRRPV